jgi:hypothetical protein
LQEARESGKFRNVCPLLVRNAAEIIQEMLETAI